MGSPAARGFWQQFCIIRQVFPIFSEDIGGLTLLQSDGNLTEEEFAKAIDLAMEGCLEVSKLQKEALMKKYSTE